MATVAKSFIGKIYNANPNKGCGLQVIDTHPIKGLTEVKMVYSNFQASHTIPVVTDF